jgi:drug/metabolite transporter (DMT)-like permease
MPFPYAGEIAAFAVACCWTLTSLAWETAARRVGSLPVNILRLVLAFAFLAAWCAIARGLPLPTDASPQAWLWLSASGLVGLMLGDLCLFRALVVIGSRLSVLLMSLVPPATALLGWAVLGERLGVVDWLGMALTVGGIGWVVLEQREDPAGRVARPSVSGVLLGVGGAVGQSVGLVLSKLGMGGYDAFAATQIRIVAGLAGFALLFAVLGWWGRVADALRDRPALSRITLAAFFGPFLGVSLSLVSVKYAPAGVAATIMALQPVLILVPAAALRKERITFRAAAGASVAVAGAALLFL